MTDLDKLLNTRFEWTTATDCRHPTDGDRVSGYLIPDRNRRELLAVSACYQVPVIAQ